MKIVEILFGLLTVGWVLSCMLAITKLIIYLAWYWNPWL